MIDQKFIQTKLTHQLRKAECSGNPAITNDKCINSTLADYKVYGNSEQDECGDNLLNIAMTPITQNGITCTKLDDGSYQFTGTSSASATFRSTNILSNRKLYKAGTYYIPDEITIDKLSLGLNFSTAPSGGTLKQVQLGKNTRTFTLSNDYYLAQWYIWFQSANIDYDFNFFPQITKADITEHKPYVSAPIPDVPCEIRSVGKLVKDQYNTDNIALWLDGEINTRNGHNNSSTKWEDLSGNNFDFIINNPDATFNDYALNFAHKGNSGKVSCTADILGTNKSITIEVCSHLLTNDTGYYWIFSNRSTNNRGFQFLNAINIDSYKNKQALRQSLFLNGNTGDYVVSSGVATDRSNTYPIAYQAITIEENRIKFYIDGELIQKYNKTLTDDEWSYLRQQYFYIGNFGSGYYYWGDIHSIRVHQTALTDGEIKRNAEIDLNRFNNKISANKYEIPITAKTDCEKYKQSIYLDEPLRAIDTYKDYIDFKQGKIIRNIAPLELKAEDLTYFSTYWKTYAIGFSKIKIGMIIDQTTKNRCFMEHYKNLGNNLNSLSALGFSNYGNINYVFIFRPDFETLAQAQQLVAGEKLIYVLATPTEEEIALQKLPQFKGTTVYTIDTETDGEFWCKYKYKN